MGSHSSQYTVFCDQGLHTAWMAAFFEVFRANGVALQKIIYTQCPNTAGGSRLEVWFPVSGDSERRIFDILDSHVAANPPGKGLAQAVSE